MIRIRIGESTLDRTRIALSPLNEMVAGLDLVHRERDRRRARWPYTDWVERAREVLRTVPETAPLRVYGQLYGAEHARRTPDLFTPVPHTARPVLAEQLDLLRRTPEATVAAQFARHYPEGLPGFLVPYLADRDRAFGRLADALTAFWSLAIAPYWPVMRAALDEEVLLRARTLASSGPEALLAELGGTAQWNRPVLSLPRRHESVLPADDQRLLLVPLILAQDRLTCSTDHPEILMVTYPARGAAVLAGRPATARTTRDRLAQLIGPGRAAVLRSLARPATTTGLAVALGLSPSTVSEQLGSLTETGAVQRSRTGRHVLYDLTPAGAALVALFADDSDPAEPLECSEAVS
ncbi:ArsR/SmtB family transcription factor [Jidongwangia harbinensis]|uniref:ArsR/SmtB family transcription factor n=1 Tax=Jidongwangia harbinensis TaxID=2878561 RepID=UPI001CDA2681|nr:winged helix-turn-helix domain-containing protein [Jidongwangia harbinensis]MCA2218287.1 winged helix-turn-helix domain-containing protein [Jidongwangia harbinensis]